ncbi:J domain-containing protein [Neolewinella aurantiaca]|uniref:J domain-containing protein n=1 Tax=Neolewinella aurantiaca TaxID=2602767 RepID=UPI00164F1739|nr:J domain-containing protein [Neolewinella aurantiaca]
MEFIDYYHILDITPSATTEEIGVAFKRQAIKWHPDKNPGTDTTERMQRINEARLILTDEDARRRYDAEYNRHVREDSANSRTTAGRGGASYQASRQGVTDDDLARWMENARRQSVDLARQTAKDFAGMSKVAAKEGAKAFGMHMAGYVLSGLFFMLLFAMMNGCN